MYHQRATLILTGISCRQERDWNVMDTHHVHPLFSLVLVITDVQDLVFFLRFSLTSKCIFATGDAHSRSMVSMPLRLVLQLQSQLRWSTSQSTWQAYLAETSVYPPL